MKSEDAEHLAERWLDAGLEELGRAEPRPGLEARILANVQAQAQGREAWWRRWWPGLVAVAVIVVAASLVLLIKPAGTAVATLPAQQARTTQIATAPASALTQAPLHPRLRTRGTAPTVTANPPVPRLEQFPSPQPLSEQEKLLARYVEERPQEAAVVARMRAELLKQEMLEFENRNPAPQESQDQKQ